MSDNCNDCKLLQFIALEDLAKICARYMVAKKHPEVTVEAARVAVMKVKFVALQQKQLQSFKEFQAVALFPRDKACVIFLR